MLELTGGMPIEPGLFDDLYDYELGKVRESVSDQVTRFRSLSSVRSVRYPILDTGNLDELDNLSALIRRKVLTETVPRIGDLLILMLSRANVLSPDEQIIPMYGSLEEPCAIPYSPDDFPIPQFAIRSRGVTTGYYCSMNCESPSRLEWIADLTLVKKKLNEIEEEVRRGTLGQYCFKGILEDPRIFPVDSIVNIVLSSSSSNKTMRERVEWNNEDVRRRRGDARIRYILLSDFLTQHFGEDEQRSFEKHVDSLNEELRDVVSLNTITVPTPLTLSSMRQELLRELEESRDDLKNEMLSLGFEQTQIDVIFANFFGRGLETALIGSKAFADSLITSEWLRGINRITSALDQTGTVSGYLKSIEQLLYEVAMLSFDTGKSMPVKWHRDERRLEEKPFDQDHYDDESLQDLSLWQLSNYFDPRNNQELLAINHRAGMKLQGLLKEFRKNSRNGYFHKDNLHDDDASEVDRIRHQTLLLHVLILGGCKIEDSDLSSIGAVQNLSEQTAREDEAAKTMSFEEWASGELSNPVVQCLLTAPGSALLFRIDNDLMVDTIQDFVDGKGTAWVIRVSVENPLPELTKGTLSDIPAYEGKSRFEWKRPCSRASTIGEVSQWLKSIDWEAFLSTKTGLPPIVLDFSNIHRTTIV